MNVLRIVLHLLEEEKALRCKPSKCEIGVKEITVLGHVVSAEGIRMSEERIAAVDAMPFPRSAKELRRYLGCVNYMRRHVRDATTLMKPLSSQVNVPVSEWPLEEMQVAFDCIFAMCCGGSHLCWGPTIGISHISTAALHPRLCVGQW